MNCAVDAGAAVYPARRIAAMDAAKVDGRGAVPPALPMPAGPSATAAAIAKARGSRTAGVALASLLLPLAVLLDGCAAKAPPAPPSTLQIPQAWRSAATQELPAGQAAPGGSPATSTATVAARAALSGAGPASAASPALPDARWWQSYGDPALSALVASALEHNGDLRVARARVAEYRARLAQAQAARQPTVSYDAAPARTRVLNAFNAPVVTNVYVAEFQAGYELDLWGRLAKQADAAQASYAAEQAGLDAVALSVAATVATGYLNLRGLDAQLELAQATLALRERSRDLARRQFEVGYSSKLEWLQAQSEYLSAQEQIPQLERQVFDQENALSVLTGGVPGAIARGTPLAQLAPPRVEAGLPSELLRRRPDIARAGRNVLAAEASLAVTRDQLLPSFRLTAQGGVQSYTLRDLVHDPFHLWKLAGVVAGPLFDGGRVQAQTDAAAAQRDQLIAAYENSVRSALAETDNALGAIAHLREQLTVNEERRAQAAETLRIAHNRYRNGYASYIEELDAQRTLYAADVARLQLKARLLVATVDLYRALGGGWGGG